MILVDPKLNWIAEHSKILETLIVVISILSLKVQELCMYRAQPPCLPFSLQKLEANSYSSKWNAVSSLISCQCSVIPNRSGFSLFITKLNLLKAVLKA